MDKLIASLSRVINFKLITPIGIYFRLRLARKEKLKGLIDASINLLLTNEFYKKELQYDEQELRNELAEENKKKGDDRNQYKIDDLTDKISKCRAAKDTQRQLRIAVNELEESVLMITMWLKSR